MRSNVGMAATLLQGDADFDLTCAMYRRRCRCVGWLFGRAGTCRAVFEVSLHESKMTRYRAARDAEVNAFQKVTSEHPSTNDNFTGV